ncbi:hypothetical protein TorRG33x02_173960 [Trema orientale]|uniref:Uncharacterized protein n=1 Tax=Trema orientale TaxID=63057 RepID=A0A2P5EMU4_TREOI|nr:hypothetical protein TorRG33x02_173960 [Trema orientale]
MHYKYNLSVMNSKEKLLKNKFKKKKRKLNNHSTINPNDLPIDPLPSISSQKSHNLSHILWLTKPPQRAALHEPVDHFLRLPGIEQIAGHRPRCNAIRRNSGALQLLRQYLRHRLYRGLRRRVRRVTRQQRPHQRRRCHDYSTSAATDQPSSCLSPCQESSFRVDIECRIPILFCRLGKRWVLGIHDPCTVDNDMDFGAELSLGFVE